MGRLRNIGTASAGAYVAAAVLTTCAVQPPMVVRSPSCLTQQRLPLCRESARNAMTPDEVVASDPKVQVSVQLRGRLVLGAGCCDPCGPCFVHLGLAREDDASVTPNKGPFVLLTSESSNRAGNPFED